MECLLAPPPPPPRPRIVKLLGSIGKWCGREKKPRTGPRRRERGGGQGGVRNQRFEGFLQQEVRQGRTTVGPGTGEGRAAAGGRQSGGSLFDSEYAQRISSPELIFLEPSLDGLLI